MKIFRSNKFISLLLLTVVLTICYSCTDENIGGRTYYISSEAKRYMIENTETFISMEDNVGLKETFRIEEGGFHNVQANSYNYFVEFEGTGGFSGTALAEVYSISYKSIMSQYYFKFSLTSEIETKLEVNWCLDNYNFSTNKWEDKNRFEYNFRTKQVSSKLKPKVKFLDSMVVKNIAYKNVIEIDYSGLKEKINENTPIKIYFAEKAGLIKFVPIEGIEVERIK